MCWAKFGVQHWNEFAYVDAVQYEMTAELSWTIMRRKLEMKLHTSMHHKYDFDITEWLQHMTATSLNMCSTQALTTSVDTRHSICKNDFDFATY